MPPRSLSLVAALLVPACSGTLDPPPGDDCPPATARSGSACVPWAGRSVVRVPTPWVEEGAAVTLEMVVYEPLTPAPHPTVVFHHGSTGNGDDPALFDDTWESGTLARVLVDAGWKVLFPQRRGRGGSGGRYDEGFTANRSRYSCQAPEALAGLERALEDAEAVLYFVRSMEGVDPERIVVGGVSRGGILAAAHAARSPGHYRGVVNVVGGWLGEGCADAVTVNRGTFTAAATGPAPVLWLYGESDPFYSAAHSRGNYDAFRAAGGEGSFHLYRRSAPGANGHFLLAEPGLWRGELERFLAETPPT
jgi:dienelactone hydrolase